MPPTSPASPEFLEVRYEVDLRDASAGFWQGTLGHPTFRRKVLPLGGSVWVAWTVYSLIKDGVYSALGYLIGTIVGFLLLPGLTRWQAKRNPAYRGPHSVCISKEGMSGWTEGFGEVRLLWRQLAAVRATAGYLFFHWKSGGTTLIPRRAFVEPGADETFLRTAQQWHQAASDTVE